MFKSAFFLFLQLIAISSTFGLTQNITNGTKIPYNSTVQGSAVTRFLIKDCGTSTDLAHNLVLEVEPKLPQTDYTLFLNTDLTKDVNSGTSKYDVTYNFIPFSPTVEDLCTEISHSNITCPLTSGHISSESKGTVPTGLSGTVIIKNQWFDTNGERILCMQFTISI